MRNDWGYILSKLRLFDCEINSLPKIIVIGLARYNFILLTKLLCVECLFSHLPLTDFHFIQRITEVGSPTSDVNSSRSETVSFFITSKNDSFFYYE